MTEQKIYLAGCMSKYKDTDFGHAMFAKEAARLRAKGFEVINPAENFNGDKTLPYYTYLRKGIEQVMSCDAVVVLDGWRESKGARAEVQAAQSVDIPVYDINLLPIPAESVYDCLRVRVKELEAQLTEAHGENLVLKTKGEDKRPITLIANDLVNGNRGEAYGHPFEDFTRSGRIMAAVLNIEEVTPEQVALCMIGIKMSRECNKSGKDNAVDIAGYAECLHKIHERRANA